MMADYEDLSNEAYEEMTGGRIEVPLVMLRGNMEALMHGVIPVTGISLKWSPDHAHAVILMVHGLDREEAAKLGFTSKPARFEE